MNMLDKIAELEVRRDKENKMLHRLQQLQVHSITKQPDWENCCNISFEAGCYDRKLFLDLLSAKLVHDNKVPMELAKSDNALWVKTEAA